MYRILPGEANQRAPDGKPINDPIPFLPPGVCGRLAGSLLALASCLCFALFSVTLRRGRSLDGTPSLLMAAILSAGACALLLLVERGAEALTVNRHDLFACSVMGIVQIGCGLVAFTAGSRHLPAADLALLAQTEVVLSPVWAWPSALPDADPSGFTSPWAVPVALPDCPPA